AAFGIGSTGRTGSIDASVDGFMNIASVTKTLTAITAIRLLKKNGINIDSTIGKWLPASWPKNDKISKLKFKQLLTHTSGIRTGNTSWNDLKQVVANAPEGNTDYVYANANFALFRAMLPKLDNNLTFEYWETHMTEENFNNWMSTLYISLVNNYVIENAGITERTCSPVSGTNYTMHNEAPQSLVSVALGDWKQSCGGGGFFMTTMDLSRIIVYMTHSNKILSDNDRALMDENRLGWNRVVAVTGGTALGHGGGLYEDIDNSGGVTAGDVGLQTLIMKFPNKVELALGINSIGNDWRNTNSIVQTAYNDAWVLE
ncbi:MAG: class A beta-lactamase-related serine hydrolase, partial [Sphingobacteriales bacterium]